MPVDRQWQLPRTQYGQPKVSEVITTRNEHPVGGEPWLDRLYQKYRDECKSVAAWVAKVDELHATVLEIGQEDRAWIAARQQMSLDELLIQAPWNLHETAA